MSQSGLPLAVIRVPVGKSVLARTLLQVGRILSLVFAPCDPPVIVLIRSIFTCGLAQVFALALAQPCHPVTLVPGHNVSVGVGEADH